ncbi:MAG: hypothetical protein M0000_11925 [Actinomycetota bacterium]|nr:hypothetical protein [Actinomycetota bacterium]
MTSGIEETLTGELTVAPPPELDVSRTLTIDELIQDTHALVERAGYLRNVNSIQGDDLGEFHGQTFQVALEARTVKEAKRGHKYLLEQLSELGFGWSDIAKMLGVSVPALRRWRLGDKPTAEHLRHIATLVAFVTMIREDRLVDDVASWMEMPLVDGVPLTSIDMYAKGQLLTVFELASEHLTPSGALDRIEPGWREKYRSDFEVYRAEDGQPAIRPRALGG